jgi:Bacterial extracellular solute-binding protein
VRTVLALLGAAFMVVAAFVIREALIEGKGGNGDDGGGGTARLVCATEVAAACDELEGDGVRVTIEPAGVTAARLTALTDEEAQDAGFDGWLVPKPWPELVRATREQAGLGPVVEEPVGPVARSPLALAVWEARITLLDTQCDDIDWNCVGEVAPSGDVRPAFPDPQTSATGRDVLGQVAAEYFGTSDVTAFDVNSDQGFRISLDVLADSSAPVPPGADPLALMLSTGGAQVDVVGAYQAQACPTLRGAARGEEVALIYPAPVATAELEFAAVTRAGGADRLEDRVTGGDGRDALLGSGWHVGDDAPDGCDSPGLPDRSNLPSAGTLQVLSELWAQVSR